MSLSVQSYPELYTLLIGWHLYDDGWNLLNQIGLTFLPFLVIIYRNAFAVNHHEAQLVFASMEKEFIATLFIVFFGCAPLMPLTPNLISYTPTCQNSSVTIGNTNTTYDKAFSMPSEPITVPILWYAVISLSEGITSAMNSSIACVPDLRSMIVQVNMTDINSPQLKQQVQNFFQQCYVPARTQYLQDEQSHTENINIINQAIQTIGPNDTEWLGSHGFQATYYQQLSATEPIPGFPYNPNNDINNNNNNENNSNTNNNNNLNPTYGTPTCANWWNDPNVGLRQQLYNQLPKSWFDNFSQFINNDATEDEVVQQIISNNSTGYNNANTTVGDDGYSHFAEGLGTLIQQTETYPKVYAAEEAAPILQAILMMLVYSFLPFAFILSNYRMKTFITGSVIIFSLIFWSFIWHLVSYLDTTLINALYPSWFAKQSPQATLADMLIASLIIFAPLFWFSFMGAMGVMVSDMVTGMMSGLSNIGSDAASKGVQTTKQIIQRMME